MGRTCKTRNGFGVRAFLEWRTGEALVGLQTHGVQLEGEAIVSCEPSTPRRLLDGLPVDALGGRGGACMAWRGWERPVLGAL